MDAFIGVVWHPIADANQSVAISAERNSELLLQGVGWTENPTHRSTASDYDLVSFGWTVPEEG